MKAVFIYLLITIICGCNQDKKSSHNNRDSNLSSSRKTCLNDLFIQYNVETLSDIAHASYYSTKKCNVSIEPVINKIKTLGAVRYE